MVDEVQGRSRCSRGARGRPKADVDALVDVDHEGAAPRRRPRRRPGRARHQPAASCSEPKGAVALDALAIAKQEEIDARRRRRRRPAPRRERRALDHAQPARRGQRHDGGDAQPDRRLARRRPPAIPTVRAIVHHRRRREGLLHGRRPRGSRPQPDRPARGRARTHRRRRGPHDPHRLAAPGRVDPRLREAGDRRRERHRGRRRHAPGARVRPGDHGRGGAFIEVFVRRGIAPDAGGAYLLTRLVGPQKAKELFFFGDDVSAAEAERIGLVNRVVPRAELEKTLTEWAERLARGPTKAIGFAKWLTNRSLDSDRHGAFWDEAYAQELDEPQRRRKRGRHELRRAAATRVQGLVGRRVEPLLLKDRTAIAGIGQTAFAKSLPASELRARPARPSRPRSTTPASTRRTSTGCRRTRWSRSWRSRWPATSAWATSPGSARSATAAAPGARVVGNAAMAVATGQCRVAVAWRSRKRGVGRVAGRGRRSAERIARHRASGRGRGACCARSTRSPMLARRYMHEYGATREHLANVAARVPRARQPQPGGDDARQADDARRLHERRAGSPSRCACSTTASSPTARSPR